MRRERWLGDAFIHPTAVVEEGATVGSGTRIWHHSHVRAQSRIGADCTVGFAVYIDTGVAIGDRCKLQNHVTIYQGVMLNDEVFVGPGVTFTNDLYPRACSLDWEVVPTNVGRGASLGANATVVCGVEVGEWSMVGAGAVVAVDVPPHGLMIGTPARLRGWVCICGRVLARLGDPFPGSCRNCGRDVEGMLAS